MTDTQSAEEVAAIKAENSRRHRAAQTTRNLVWALVATLIVVLFLFLVVVRPDPAAVAPIDYATVASQSQADEPLAAPVLPSGWSANRADLTKSGDIQVWYIGLVTPSNQFVALNQGIKANPTWVSNLLSSAKPTGTATIGGIEWTVYDHRDDDDPGNLAYALVTEVGDSTYVLHGTASDDEFALLAQAIGLS